MLRTLLASAFIIAACAALPTTGACSRQLTPGPAVLIEDTRLAPRVVVRLVCVYGLDPFEDANLGLQWRIVDAPGLTVIEVPRYCWGA